MVGAQCGGAVSGLAGTEITVCSKEKCPLIGGTRQFLGLAAGSHLCGGAAGKECGTQHNEPTVDPPLAPAALSRSLPLFPHLATLLPLYNTPVVKRRHFLQTAAALIGAPVLPQSVATRSTHHVRSIQRLFTSEVEDKPW